MFAAVVNDAEVVNAAYLAVVNVAAVAVMGEMYNLYRHQS